MGARDSPLIHIKGEDVEHMRAMEESGRAHESLSSFLILTHLFSLT